MVVELQQRQNRSITAVNFTYAKQTEAYTANNPLLQALLSAKLNATGQRWVNELAEFNIIAELFITNLEEIISTQTF